MASEAGWYPDPQGRHEYRYHDGNGWTEDVSDAGVASKDPLDVVPEPGGTAEVAGEPSHRARRRWWLIGGLGAAAVAAVVVVVVLLVSGGGGEPAEPLVGVFEGGGDDVDVTLTVDGDPPALTELMVAAACGRVSSSQTIEFSSPRPIKDGRFEVFLPPPGGLELDGTFVDDGRRVEGHVVAGGCDEDWTADLVDGVDASGDHSDGNGVPSANAVEWIAPDATLSAENFYLEAGGLIFTAATAEVDVHGDPAGADGDRTTIEVTWYEHDREMRVFVYLESDGDSWWADEIRAYDGADDPDWVTFEDRYFTTPVGAAFEVDEFELVGIAEDTGAEVLVHFDGLRIETALSGDDDTSTPTVPGDDDTSTPTVPDDGVPVDAAVFRDDFDGTLDAGWEWLNEDPRRWSLDTRPGWVSIVAQDETPTGIPNVLVRPALSGDNVVVVVVTTLVAFEPTSDFQFAGLVVSGPDADTDRVQFGRAYCDGPICAGDGLYFDRIEGGVRIGDNFAIPFEGTPELYLQLVILPDDAAGSLVVAGYSFDGDDWFEAGMHTVDFAIGDVGLVAHQAPQEITAAFDFFEVETFSE
jgi:hypothetical protein